MDVDKSRKGVLESKSIFGQPYMRAPDAEDTARLMQMGEAIKGVPGYAWMHRLHALEVEKLPPSMARAVHWALSLSKIILEVIASHDLWMWHAYFGLPGSHNGINILQRSLLFTRLAVDDAPPVNFEVITTPLGTILQMAYILHGPHLSRQ